MRSNRLLKPLGSKGDTIIEVLLAIAIVSAVLGGAFVSANRSLQGTRVSLERSEATKLVQGQAELLGAASSDPATSADIFNNVAVNSSFFLQNNLQRGGGSSYTDGIYRISITREPASSFRIHATWQKVGSGTTEQMFIRYRVYPNP